jgi:large subunit ribosomal protein L13
VESSGAVLFDRARFFADGGLRARFCGKLPHCGSAIRRPAPPPATPDRSPWRRAGLPESRIRIMMQDFAELNQPLPEHPMKTFSAKPHEVERDWFVVDATDKVLGRLASQIALRLRGKHKAIYTPHVDTGDFIVVTNVEKLRVTGNKAEDKLYHRHSGYPGGISTTNFSKMQQRFPGRALEKAVKGMLPKGPLGYKMLKKLKCYAGTTHPHTAQQPKSLDI